MQLSDKILADTKVLADALEVIRISLGEHDAVGLCSEFIFEEFVEGYFFHEILLTISRARKSIQNFENMSSLELLGA